MPRILHRRRQDDNDNGAERNPAKLAIGMAVSSHGEPPAFDSSTAQLSPVGNMPVEVRCTKIKNWRRRRKALIRRHFIFYSPSLDI
jgi:hypothetical protein